MWVSHHNFPKLISPGCHCWVLEPWPLDFKTLQMYSPSLRTASLSVDFCQGFAYLQYALQNAGCRPYQIMGIPVRVPWLVSLSSRSVGHLSTCPGHPLCDLCLYLLPQNAVVIEEVVLKPFLAEGIALCWELELKTGYHFTTPILLTLLNIA